MAKIYIVMAYSRDLVAAFTFPELAQEYADQQMIANFRIGYKFTSQLGPPYGKHLDSLKKLGLPNNDLLSDYSEEQLLTIIRYFHGDSYRVKEVDWLA